MNDFQAALADERAGRRQQAYESYRAIVARDARNAQALHRLGLTAFHLGRPQEALEWLQKALAVTAGAELLLDFASVLQEIGRWVPAAAAFAAALKQVPGSVDGWFGRAVCLHQSGRAADAAAAYRRALALRPDIAAAYENLGRVLLATGRAAAAADALNGAVRLSGGSPGLWNTLGVALHQAGRNGAAAAFHAALRLNPTEVEALRNLCSLSIENNLPAEAAHRRLAALCPADAGALNAVGNTLFAAGDFTRAAAAYSAARRGGVTLVEPTLNLADTLRRLGRRAETLAALRDAVARAPQNERAQRILGRLLAHELDHDGALDAFTRAAALAPADIAALTDLGGAALRARRPDIAERAYARLLTLTPDDPAALGHLIELKNAGCDWAAATVLEDRLLDRLRRGKAAGVPPFVLLGLANATSADQRTAAEAWAALKAAGTVPVKPPSALPSASRSSDRRIRLGYLSSDFREHAISYLVAGVLEAHDRRRFVVRAYSIGPDDGGAMRRRIAGGVERFVDLAGEGDAAAAQRIADDGVDILIDVNGYTAFARTAVTAARPAPIQVNWLGHPGTMGAGFIDYIIADRHLIAPEDEAHYSEAVVRLPDCYQPNDRARPIADATPSRAACGLPDDGFVFCCFNNLYKITGPVFALWLDILRRTPDSALWLLEGRPDAAARLRRAAEDGGVDARRLVFAPPTSLPQHLARHRRADLFLDTLPYNAHTTGSDALWAGLPLLTCRGRTFAGRVGTSLVAAAGLPELSTATPAAYAAMAVELAGDPERLRDVKQRLAAQRLTCPLFDDVRFARRLETAFAAMHARRLNGEAPRTITVNADAFLS